MKYGDYSIQLQSKKGNKKDRIPVYWYIALFIVVYLATLAISKFESLDLFSWIEDSEKYLYGYNTLSDVISYCLSSSIDFIYQSIVYLAAKNSLSLTLITAIIVTFYFYLILKIMSREWSGKMEFLLVVMVLFTTPITWTVAITRNLTAVMFLYLGILFYYNGKRLPMLICFVAGVFTHFSVILYVLVFLFAMLLSKRCLSVRSLVVILGGVLLFSIISTDFVSDIINAFALRYDTRYSAYSEMNSDNFLLATTINYGDKLPVLFAIVLSVFLLINSKLTGFPFWGLFMLTVLLLFFVTTRFFLINRCMLVMPLFWGLNIAEIYRDSGKKVRINLKNLALIGLVPILLHLFSYRNHYFPFFF